MRTLGTILIVQLLFVACDKCEDESKRFNPELFPTERKTYYDWDRLSEVTGDTIFFGVGTEYFKCEATIGQEELLSTESEFISNRDFILNSDTIFAGQNLLEEELLEPYVRISKDEDAFFNPPQYIITIQKNNLSLEGYFTFMFRGVTVSGVEIIDSTIVKIK